MCVGMYVFVCRECEREKKEIERRIVLHVEIRAAITSVTHYGRNGRLIQLCSKIITQTAIN